MKLLPVVVLLNVAMAGSVLAQDLEPARHIVASARSRTSYQVDVLLPHHQPFVRRA